jgi:predicted DNA-binding protein
MKVDRPRALSIRLSEAEDQALYTLAEVEGLPKSIYLRRTLRMAIYKNKEFLPKEIFEKIKKQYTEAPQKSRDGDVTEEQGE